MLATSADSWIFATGRPARIPTPASPQIDFVKLLHKSLAQDTSARLRQTEAIAKKDGRARLRRALPRHAAHFSQQSDQDTETVMIEQFQWLAQEVMPAFKPSRR
jgi:hypothetical protein